MGDVIRKVPLTRAAGYTSHNLATRPLDEGVTVGATLRPASDTSRLRRLSGSFEVFVHDGTTTGLARIAADVAPDVVSHLAAASIAAHTDDDMKPLIHSNVLLGSQLLGALCAAGARSQTNTGTLLAALWRRCLRLQMPVRGHQPSVRGRVCLPRRRV